ncbi:TPA: hypothetical protein ACNVLA_003755 [Klebsiella aerogenes]
MNKSTITRERLEEMAVEDDLYNYPPTQEELNALARMALATMDSEPAMYVMGMGQALDAETASTCKGAVDSWVGEWTQSRLPGQAEYKTVPLYRHAHPAPVALKDHQMRELVNQLRDTAIQYHGTQQLREQIARVIRAAMLQAEPVTTTNKSPPNSFTNAELEGMAHGDNPQSNAYRELLAYRRNSPVIPDGWKLVPVKPSGDMLAAAQDAYGETDGDIASTLRAAIAAAPQEVK